jgi:hypothetical protein
MAVIARRMSAHIEGEFVVFLIGARVNHWWQLGKFKWVGQAMNAMIAELEKQPESGFLGHESWVGRTTIAVQYWRSMEQLVAYARQRDSVHFPAWVRFNKEIGSDGSIGIWHESYVVKPGNYECVYNNMPPFGLGRVAQSLPAEGKRNTARGRLGEGDGSDAPIAADGETPHRATP